MVYIVQLYRQRIRQEFSRLSSSLVDYRRGIIAQHENIEAISLALESFRIGF